MRCFVAQVKRIKKIFKTVLCCILAVITCAIVYAVAFSAVVKAKNPDAMPMPYGFGASIVLSGSMEPEIATDDLVFIKKHKELHVGDIVLYNNGGSNVIHRIVSINGDTIITKGDANNTADKPISKSSVLGVYVGKISGVGKFVRFVTNPPFIISVVFILMAIAITWIFIDERNERKRLESIQAKIDCLKAENEELRKKL